MAELPIRRMIVYKHGVGYFERRGPVSGASLRLSFPRAAMDDVLKSLVALDLGAGRVLGVDFETPEDRAAQVARGSIHLSDARSLLDLLRDLRGRSARLQLRDDDEPPLEGLVIGVDLEEERLLRAPVVSIYLADRREVRAVPLRRIAGVTILDDRAAADLGYFLRAAQTEEDRRSATLRLSEGEHELLVGYIAPAPAWRVSYRLLFEPAEAEPAAAADTSADGRSSILLQGWGMFDNQLDEDLQEVELTLVAGMPVSFRYRLYEPHTPERPLIADEERTVAAPVEFAGLPPPAPAAAPAPAGARRMRALLAAEPEAAYAPQSALDMDALASSTQVAGVGAERGALFQYRVAHPVSVARGQSAMVPIVGARLAGRKELLYNGRKQPNHPVATLRLRNETGLTLERGPVTVVEQGDYAGEAVLPFSREGAELIVAYAVELGVRVTEQQRSERHMAGIAVRNEYLLVEEWDVQRTSYQIASTLAAPTVVTVEQALQASYELFDTAAPAEQAQGVARWPVACAPGAETTFAVSQRARVSRREQVRGLDRRRLSQYLRERFLDDATFRALDGVLSLYESIERAQKALQELDQRRQKLYTRQQQTQGSLTPLGREGKEGALRERYVALLGEIEDELGRLAAEEGRLREEIERLERDAAAALAALTP